MRGRRCSRRIGQTVVIRRRFAHNTWIVYWQGGYRSRAIVGTPSRSKSSSIQWVSDRITSSRFASY